ncbi:hypothetical protein L1987_87117 [Smallanthus sonchifolius]|nr:hypothetical protein L1987_87117 [Smallanthus sonchifolius]
MLIFTNELLGRHRCTTNQQSYLILVSEILISIGFCSSGNTISIKHYFEGTKVSGPDKRGGFMTVKRWHSKWW